MRQKQIDLFADRLKDGTYRLHATGAILDHEAFKKLHRLMGGHAIVFSDFRKSQPEPGEVIIRFNDAL